MRDDELQRFMRLVEQTETCWIWIGALNKRYGTFATKIGDKWKNRRAHRVSYEHFNGDLGDKLVCHKCDNPKCVNPSHLFLGTQKDNLEDASRKGRTYRGGPGIPWNRHITHCKRGHELSGDNLVKSKRGARVCKQCMRDAQRAMRDKKRAATAMQKGE